MHERMLSERTLQMLCGGCSVLVLPLKLRTGKNPRWLYFEAVLEIPCTFFFFFKDVSPQRQPSKCGGQVIRNTSGGDREGSREPAETSARASQGFAALSVTGAGRTSPGMAGGLSPVTRPHKPSGLPPGLGGDGGGKGSLLRAARRARHHEGGRTVGIRKSWSHTWY